MFRKLALTNFWNLCYFIKDICWPFLVVENCWIPEYFLNSPGMEIEMMTVTLKSPFSKWKCELGKNFNYFRILPFISTYLLWNLPYYCNAMQSLTYMRASWTFKIEQFVRALTGLCLVWGQIATLLLSSHPWLIKQRQEQHLKLSTSNTLKRKFQKKIQKWKTKTV